MGEQVEKQSEAAAESSASPLPALLGFLIWIGVGVIFAATTEWGKAFLSDYWWILIATVVALVLVSMLPQISAKLRRLTLEARTGLIVFAVLPALLLLVVGIVLLPEAYRVVAMRMVFLAIVVLLPATMYYLFIVTRKDSLLNEYIAILDRLGLMQPSRLQLSIERQSELPYEGLLGPRLRIETFLQRFEAAYGPIAADIREEFVNTLIRGFDPQRLADDRRFKGRSSVGFTEVFNLSTAVPVIVATALFALGWLMVLPPISAAVEGRVIADGLKTSLDPYTGPVGFAFLGAYFFALQALFRRYVRRDLRASAYVSISIRVVIAVIGTWVVVEIARALPGQAGIPETALTIVGFVIGVFPQVAWQYVRKVMTKVTAAELAIPSLQSQLPLSDLDGLTVWHESRLEEEDIENISNMATVDLSDLMLNTRFSRGRIIDWVDQAILYVHLGPQAEGEKLHSSRERFRALGIRTASALLVAYDQSIKRADDKDFEKLLDEGGVRPGRVKALVDAIATSSNIDPILTWKSVSPQAPRLDMRFAA